MEIPLARGGRKNHNVESGSSPTAQLMRRLLTITAFLAASCLLLAPALSPVEAQRLGPHVDRPRLRDVPDTNDANAYFAAGIALFETDPARASAAFYWAARLRPEWGDPLYARRAALLVLKPNLLRNLMSGARRSRSDEMRRLDSLQFRALMLNPFIYRQLDRQLFVSYITEGARTVDPNVHYEINTWMQRSSPATRAWYAYGTGSFDRALSHYADAIKQERDAAYLHLERARIFGMRNEVDSAVADFKLALDKLRKKDEKDLVVFYDSKAQVEFSTAVLLEGAGRRDEARAAYGRALEEDLAYYPAHLRLGLLALSTGDTATAVSELGLAAQIAPDEPFVRYMHGYVLGRARRSAEAVTELQKALALEPLYALAYLVLGTQWEHQGKGAEAIAAYEKFLNTASLRDPQRTFATTQLKDLREIVQPASP